MIIANKNDRGAVIDILAEAFDDNQSVNYIVGPGSGRKRRIQALMAYSFDVCQLFGEVWLSDDRKACLLYLYPERKKTNFRSILLDIRLIWQAIGICRTGLALKREKLIARKQLKGKTLYLWFIGIKSGDQRKGAGTALLKELIDVADIEFRNIILETSTTRNLPWYEKLGFSTYDELELSYHLHFLKKEPD
ncbi:GNAT family N-acetyltransferase [Mucilaginibacter terrae]|uniref:N-acetyltransferase domain-containing protein n=1 Tax=Mucilaginibacter terrae TaxID=1955052 RepID=A0ABU3GS56_9SPHI|nr:GNAT family N-acetyltransferase [Mucilaginibacter terrae]MDT3402306.1 hypothetical protein [Mucilaginibacter terrae]